MQKTSEPIAAMAILRWFASIGSDGEEAEENRKRAVTTNPEAAPLPDSHGLSRIVHEPLASDATARSASLCTPTEEHLRSCECDSHYCALPYAVGEALQRSQHASFHLARSRLGQTRLPAQA